MVSKQKPPQKNMSNALRLTLFWVLLVLGVLGFLALSSSKTTLKDVAISSVIDRAKKGEISKIEGSGNELTVTVKGQNKPTEQSYIDGGVGALIKDNDLDKQAGIVLKDSAPSQTNDVLWNIAIIIVPVILIGALFITVGLLSFVISDLLKRYVS